MRKHSWRKSFPFLALALVLATGCSTGGVQRYTPNFEYSPPERAKTAGAEVTFAVVNASFSQPIPLFQEFGRNMAQDFYEMLNSRGYTVRGPFGKYDDLTFPDKKGSDLILVPELDLTSDGSAMEWDQSFGAALFGGTAFTGEGTLVLRGRINLLVYESLSHEKMWTKSVDIPMIRVPIEETRLYSTPGVPIETLLGEQAIYNNVAKALEEQYKAILERAYVYLDPEEMRIVKKQAQDIRNRKVY